MSEYLDAALRRMRLGVRVRYFDALKNCYSPIWAIAHHDAPAQLAGSPESATEKYLRTCRTLDPTAS